MEDDELPSNNQDLGTQFSPVSLGEKSSHASLVGHDRRASSVGIQKGHHQSTEDQDREGHHDLQHAGHGCDQLHSLHASSHSGYRHFHQQPA